MQESDETPMRLMDQAEVDARPARDHLRWGTFRPPPPLGLVFGVVYGAVAGAIIAYDVTVLIRLGRIVRARIREQREGWHASGD